MQQMMKVVEVAEELGRLFAFGGTFRLNMECRPVCIPPSFVTFIIIPIVEIHQNPSKVRSLWDQYQPEEKTEGSLFFQFSAKMNCASGTVVWSVSLNIWLTPISSCHHIHQIFTDKVLVWLLTHVSLTLFSGKIFDSQFWVKLILDGISGYFPV